ncbi:MAG TPA: site-specific integrase [Dehalococcoidia bacterium]|nr:site-specific integrase [Dehalococcoidia bacterium]
MAKRRANGEGTIFQRKDGRWMAMISLPNGERRQFINRDRSIVAAQLTEALHDQLKGIPIATSSHTVSQYLAQWLDHTGASVRPRTHEAYALNVRRLEPLLGRTKLAALTPQMIDAAYQQLLGEGLSKRSVEQCHTVLHGALEKALKWGLVGRNACDAVTPPRPERSEMKTLSEEQVRRLFEASADDRLHALWVLLATTGLRLGEAIGLRWQDIDFALQTLTVRRALQRQRGAGLVFVEPKTRRSRRTIALPNGTIAAIQAHRKRQLEERLQVGAAWRDQDLVFCRWDGGPLEPSGLAQRFDRLLRQAGLPDIRVHDLRHTAASLHLMKGTHPKLVQEMLGHSTITLTLDTYSHVTPGMHADAARKMESLFAPAATAASASS